MQGLLEESLHHYEGKLNLQQAAQNMTTINNTVNKSVKCFTSAKEKIKQNNSGAHSTRVRFHYYKLAYLKILTIPKLRSMTMFR